MREILNGTFTVRVEQRGIKLYAVAKTTRHTARIMNLCKHKRYRIRKKNAKRLIQMIS